MGPQVFCTHVAFPFSPQMSTQSPCLGGKRALIEALQDSKGPQHPHRSFTSHTPGRMGVPGHPEWTETPLRGLALPLVVPVLAVGSELFKDPE